MKKKLLLLGGSSQQMIAIETAKRLGYYTILCDFLLDNPGQYIADEFHLVSTTDKEEILKIAEKEEIHGILAYASDPAAPTAAYVAEKLNLPGSPYKSVDLLCNKDKFRKFLSENNFNTPTARGYSDLNEAKEEIKKEYFKLPVIVKPVDSSGSKGVSKISSILEINEKLEEAMRFSREKRIIIEEFVEMYGYQVAGDGLSIDGKLVFKYFANDHFNYKSPNPFVPISASFPYNMPIEIHEKIHSEIQRLLTLLNMKTSTYNFDIRIDKDFNVYLMEVASRSGGNYIPQMIRYATDIDLIEASIKGAMGETITLPSEIKAKGYYAYYALHNLESGILEKIEIEENVLKNNIIENHILKKPGDEIKAFTCSNTTLGILLMKFETMKEMLDMMDNSEKWINIKVK